MSYLIESKVYQNGTEVEASGWTVERDADSLTGKWSIELADPVEVEGDDTWTIDRLYSGAGGSGSGFVLAGSGSGNRAGVSNVRLVDNCLADNQSSSLVQDVSRNISGLTESIIDPDLSLGEDIYFVNSAWLDEYCGYGWHCEYGILYYGRPTSLQTASGIRVLHSDYLPAANQEVGTFTCLPGTWTHHSIAGNLAQRLGCQIVINVPNITVLRSMRIASDTGIFEAINQIFSLWNASIMVVPGDIPVIHVLDTCGESQTKSNPGSIRLQAKAIKGIERSSTSVDKAKIVDHVIVIGAKSVNYVSTGQAPQGGTDTITEKSMSENFSVVSSISFQPAIARKKMGDYKKGFNKKGAKPQLRPTQTVQTDFYHQEANNQGTTYLLRSLTQGYNADGKVIQKIEVTHTYGVNNKVIYTIETLHQEVAVPGKNVKEYRLIRNKIVDQTNQNKLFGVALAYEVVEELVLGTEMTDLQSGEKYIAAPQTLISAQSQVSTNPNTKQKLIEMDTKYRNVLVNRAAEGTWFQITAEYDVLQETTKIHSQTLQEPVQKLAKKEDNFRAEFKYGTGPYHKAVKIEHQDIDNTTLARDIANRVFARSSTAKEEFDIVLTAPASIGSTVFSITVPEISVGVRSSRGTRTRRFVGGDFLLVGTSERLKISGDTVDHEIRLRVRNVL